MLRFWSPWHPVQTSHNAIAAWHGNEPYILCRLADHKLFEASIFVFKLRTSSRRQAPGWPVRWALAIGGSTPSPCPWNVGSAWLPTPRGYPQGHSLELRPLAGAHDWTQVRSLHKLLRCGGGHRDPLISRPPRQASCERLFLWSPLVLPNLGPVSDHTWEAYECCHRFNTYLLSEWKSEQTPVFI